MELLPGGARDLSECGLLWLGQQAYIHHRVSGHRRVRVAVRHVGCLRQRSWCRGALRFFMFPHWFMVQCEKIIRGRCVDDRRVRGPRAELCDSVLALWARDVHD